MFQCKMTAQELIAEQLGHLCSRGVMDSSEEQLSKRSSFPSEASAYPSQSIEALTSILTLCRQLSANLW